MLSYFHLIDAILPDDLFDERSNASALFLVNVGLIRAAF